MFIYGLVVGVLVGMFGMGILSGRAYEKGYNDGWLKGMVERERK